MCIEAVTNLVDAHAWHGQAPEEERSTWKAPDHLRHAASTLAARGSIARVSEGDEWQLTQAGVQSLTFLLRLHSPEPAFDASRRSARKVVHMTRLELWSALEAGGWSCQPRMSPKRQRAILDWDLEVDSPEHRIFYLTSGASPLPSAKYMQALLSRDTLLSLGVRTLPHFRTATFYAGVLQNGVVHIRAPGPEALQDDGEVIPPLPLADAPRNPPRAARPARRHDNACAKLGPFSKRFARRRRVAHAPPPAVPPAEAAALSPAPASPAEAVPPSP